MYSFTELNNKADLKILYEKTTGRELRRHSNQWEGYCPFCQQGTDRFYISDRIPHKWFCRVCNPSGGSALDYVASYYHLPTHGAGMKDTANKLADILDIVEADAQYTGAPTQHKEKETEYVPVLPNKPSEKWQQEVKTAVLKARDYLFTPSARPQLEYLMSRGFTEKTIADYYIGFNKKQYDLNVTVTDRVTRKETPVTVYNQTYLFPCFAQIQSTDTVMDIVRVKVRIEEQRYKYLLARHEADPERYRKPQKYWFISGGEPKSLFCAKYALKYPNIIYVEGELDAMTINQTAGDICKAVTFGSHSYIGNAEQWQAWYRAPENTVICFDNDSDPVVIKAVRKDEQHLQREIMKAQAQDEISLRGNAPVIKRLPEQYHDWNDILQLPNGTQIIREYLTDFFRR